MSKKKIIILIIVLLILVGLVWFFWPKKISGWDYKEQSWYLNNCIGIIDSRYPLEGVGAVCYGLICHEQYQKNPLYFEKANYCLDLSLSKRFSLSGYCFY